VAVKQLYDAAHFQIKSHHSEQDNQAMESPK